MKMNHYFKPSLIVLVGASALLFAAGALNAQCCTAATATATALEAKDTCCGSTQQVSLAEARPSVPIAVVFHADWCGNCKALAPKVAAAREKLGSNEVLFVTLDFTNDDTRAQSELLAQALGLGDILAAQGGRPGMLLVVDGNEKKVLHTFTRQHEADAIHTSLSR